MNPPRKTTGLFLTPRGPYGRRLPERARKHMRASEDEPRLPEEDKDGRWQGKVGVEGERHGKPDVSVEFEVNTNPTHKETASQSDFLWEGRSGYDPHLAELQKQRVKDRKLKAAQDAQRAKQPSRQP